MLIFASIFGVGFIILIIGFIFGGDGDADAGSDVGGDAHDGAHGPSIFSVRMIALLMVGFGAVGFGARATTDWTMFQASMAGVGGAVVIGIAGYLVIRAFYASQASSTIADHDIIGATANMIDAIDGAGNGQVACVVRGREITFLARSADGQSIPRGAPVRIVSKSGSRVTVERANNQVNT
ncbi:MAG: NfeD family protein [Candidatus Zixiibacteriota bacterium]|nr:MAG: NfeD family protein [candidate division Zixibacteria bacterium]